MSQVNPSYGERSYGTSPVWRKGMFALEAQVGVMIPPTNAAGTPFGEVRSGTPMGVIAGGIYAGWTRPCGKSLVAAGASGKTVTLLSPANFYALDRVEFLGTAPAICRGNVSTPKSARAGGGIDIEVDGGAAQQNSLTGTAAAITGESAAYDTTIQEGDKLVLIVNDERQEVVFAGTEATQAAWHEAINAALYGARAVNASNQTKLESDLIGHDSSLLVHADSTAAVLTALGLTAGASDSGDGDAADFSALAPKDIVAYLMDPQGGNLQGAIAFVDDDGFLAIQSTASPASDGSIKVSGTLATLFGLPSATQEPVKGAQKAVLQGIDKTTGVATLDVDVTVEAGDVCRLDTAAEGYAGADEAAGILDFDIDTYNQVTKTHEPQGGLMAFMGIGYQGQVAGYNALIAADLTDTAKGRFIVLQNFSPNLPPLRA